MPAYICSARYVQQIASTFLFTPNRKLLFIREPTQTRRRRRGAKNRYMELAFLKNKSFILRFVLKCKYEENLPGARESARDSLVIFTFQRLELFRKLKSFFQTILRDLRCCRSQCVSKDRGCFETRDIDGLSLIVLANFYF